MKTQPTLEQLLEGYLVATLNSIAAANGFRGAAKGKQAVVALLARELPRAGRVKEAVAGLDPVARTLLDLLRLAGGRANWETLLLWCRLGLLPAGPPTLPARSYGSASTVAGDPASNSAELQHVLARLESAGLVLGSGHRDSYDPNKALGFGLARSAIIPDAVAAQLPNKATLKLAPASKPVTVLEGDPQASQRQLFLLWSWFWRAEPQLLKATKLLAKRELKLLATALPGWVTVEPTEDRQHWLLWSHKLLLRLRLLHEAERSQGLVAAAEAYWSQPFEDRLGQALDACLDLAAPVELTVAGQEPDGAAAATWTIARRHLLKQIRILHGAAENGWAAVADLTTAMAIGGRDALVSAPLGHSYSYGYQDPNRYRSGRFFTRTLGGIADDASGWAVVERPFILRQLLQLWWLGLVDLGLAEGMATEGAPPPLETITHLRLTAWGRRLLLDEAAPAQPEAEARIVLQPNFQILVLGPVAESRLLTLERIADRSSADRAIVYKLSRDSVYRGQRAGISVAEMLRSLAELTGDELPQNVTHSLRDWQQLHERVVLQRGALLLQTADAEEAGRAVAALGEEALIPLGEGFLQVREVPALHRYLQTADLMLELESAEQLPPERRIVVEADGRLRLPLPCLDPRSLGRVQRLAEGDSAAGWRLTEAAAGRCKGERGLDAATQLAQWQGLTGEPLPEALARKIQRGTSEGGQARLHRGSYLELPDEATLRSLAAALPLLAGRLRALPLRGPLLQVDEASLPAVAAALDALGLTMSEGPATEEPASTRATVALGKSTAPAPTPPGVPKRRGRPPKAR